MSHGRGSEASTFPHRWRVKLNSNKSFELFHCELYHCGGIQNLWKPACEGIGPKGWSVTSFGFWESHSQPKFSKVKWHKMSEAMLECRFSDLDKAFKVQHRHMSQPPPDKQPMPLQMPYHLHLVYMCFADIFSSFLLNYKPLVVNWYFIMISVLSAA